MAEERSLIFIPVVGAVVTSTFGFREHPVSGERKFHTGIDLAAYEGAPIRSLGAGRVVFAGIYRGYGNLIVLRHARGYTSHYGHCKKITVTVGQFVHGGQILGAVGSTGQSTGPHLHFEVRRNGRAIDPLLEIDNFPRKT